MARVEGAIICLLILAIDVAAGVLGIEAEMVQNKGRHLRVFFIECKEPVHQAYKLGIAAAALLALSHAVANVLGGCPCICSRDQWDNSMPNKQMASVTLIFSWIVAIVGFTMLMIGAMSNSKSRVRCGLVRRHFLSIGGILCFVHALFCMVYYVSAHASVKEEGKAQRNIRSHGLQA
ncbi:uncharacterized protein LOC122049356 [Zingiber officinale]|uniref:Uncharacterized protein n=1 Tax=Zingiber officinale TaxID=94328 RepID=A0A8J5HI88_ZINOF|nr:uncharacterized protein LOC122039934 isoform X1 [Zingiber officinale]XP_042466683.1 uncharacterized protein LOC122049356 [Zingiber officinale]KAG6525102.1 hypothetical protein ZIOFF_015054 [Zingiber officinale]KAG6528958.1 hypothetical protein ZIOFF_011150 [Zingiber officinale]